MDIPDFSFLENIFSGKDIDCGECRVKKASVLITRLEDGKPVILHLCKECASKAIKKDKPEISVDLNLFMEKVTELADSVFGSGKSGIFDMNELISKTMEAVTMPAEEAPIPARTCSGCGTTSHDFRKTERLGCENCYKELFEVVEPAIQTIHGHLYHVGKAPVFKGERGHIRRKLRDLKYHLNLFIASEAYEEAAKIRDEISELEIQLETNSTIEKD